MKTLILLLALALSNVGLFAQTSAELAAMRQEVEASKARALKLYPDANNPATPLGKAVENEIERMRTADDPALHSVKAPELIAAAVASRLGIAPVMPPAPINAKDDAVYEAWFRKYGLDLNDPKMLESDPDRDGYTNRQEFLADTNPLDASSHPAQPRIMPFVLPSQQSKSAEQVAAEEAASERERQAIIDRARKRQEADTLERIARALENLKR